MTKDSYRTPRPVFDYYHQTYNFALDTAASEQNALLPYFITEQENTHEVDWFAAAGCAQGRYAWTNPPYSNIGPFVDTAIKWQAKGFGCVMLVMMDQSVGWYKRAIQHCQEVHLVIGGRLAFINPVTNEPAKGNNKGSMFLVFHPYGRPCEPRYSHVERDALMLGVEGCIKSEEAA